MSRCARLVAVAVAAVATLAACKSSHRAAAVVKHDAAVLPDAAIDWSRCTDALKADQTAPGFAADLVAACAPCDLRTILAWDRPQAEGGPTHEAIRAAMEGCSAFCTGAARDRFLGTVDDARGATRMPWRLLGEQCKGAVSADGLGARFATASLFALDRVARSVAAHGGDAAHLLGQITILMPLVSATGNGVSPVVAPPNATLDPVHRDMVIVTVIASDPSVGRIPLAELGANGVTVLDVPRLYPGDVAPKVGEAIGGSPIGDIALLAPPTLPAKRIYEVVAAAAGSPGRWKLLVRRSIDHPIDIGVALLHPTIVTGHLPGAPAITLTGAPIDDAAFGKPGALEIHLDGKTTVEVLTLAIARASAAGIDRVALIVDATK